MSSLLKTGNIYSTDFCYGEVPLKYDPFDFETYEKDPMEFYVVSTDVETGKPVYHKYAGMSEGGFDWIRASASMPLVSRIVEINGQKLLDGGISDSIPVEFFESLGYDRNVAVLTQPKTYKKSKNKMMPLIKIKYRKYPKFIETVENRHIMYNAETALVSEKEHNGTLFVIRPESPLPVGRVEKDPEKLKEAYEIGRSAMKERLEDLLIYLNK